MSDVEVTREEMLTRDEAARRLATLAAAIADDDKVEVALGSSRVKVHVPDQVQWEIELEIGHDKVELEVELSWTAPRLTPVSE